MLWIIISIGSIVLLVAAVKKNDDKKCNGININISGVSSHYFIDKNDVENVIVIYSGVQQKGKSIKKFDLRKMEKALKNDIWIKDAEIYFDNNAVLQVEISEREPVARIFTPGGTTFYIDSSLMMLPLSDKYSARLPVFTGFPTEAKVLKHSDSSLLKDIRNISLEIQNDAFLMGMIDQVDITVARSFEMIPKIGNQLIKFGDASDIKEKFSKLKLFYKNILVKTGWNKYSVINLQYKGQVVGKIRGADDVTADSIRTMQIMQLIAANTEKMASDSMKTITQDSDKNTADSTMLLQSIQRDENNEGQSAFTKDMNEITTVPIIEKLQAERKGKQKTEIKKAVSITNKPPTSKIKVVVKKPKQVMEKKTIIKNDY